MRYVYTLCVSLLKASIHMSKHERSPAQGTARRKAWATVTGASVICAAAIAGAVRVEGGFGNADPFAQMTPDKLSGGFSANPPTKTHEQQAALQARLARLAKLQDPAQPVLQALLNGDGLQQVTS